MLGGDCPGSVLKYNSNFSGDNPSPQENDSVHRQKLSADYATLHALLHPDQRIPITKKNQLHHKSD